MLLVGSVFLVPPLDVAALAEAVGAACDMDCDEREWRTARAAAAARAAFGLNTFIEATLGAYSETLRVGPYCNL